MIHKFEYATQEERTAILSNNPSFYIQEEQNITEGNFLILTDAPTVDVRVQELEEQNAQMLLALVEGGLI